MQRIGIGEILNVKGAKVMKPSMATMNISIRELTPGAVARCTGLSQALQRVWRKRGHVGASPSGAAKFDVSEAMGIFVRQQLSKFGVPPSKSVSIGDRAGRTAMYFALLNVSGACEVFGSQSDVEDFLTAYEDTDEIAKFLSGADATSRFLWRGESGIFLFESDIQKAFDREKTVAVSIVDLMVLGTRFGNLAESPLFTVVLGGNAHNGHIRRLTSPLSIDADI